jgi:hypothetical protein
VENNVNITGALTILNCAMAMDGGSKALMAMDDTGQEIRFYIPQHVIQENFSRNNIPGRLHVNNKPIEVRSDEENEIVRLLKEAKIKFTSPSKKPDLESANRIIIGDDIKDYFSAVEKGPDHALAFMVKEIIDFVSSEEYVIISQQFPKA